MHFLPKKDAFLEEITCWPDEAAAGGRGNEWIKEQVDLTNSHPNFSSEKSFKIWFNFQAVWIHLLYWLNCWAYLDGTYWWVQFDLMAIKVIGKARQKLSLWSAPAKPGCWPCCSHRTVVIKSRDKTGKISKDKSHEDAPATATKIPQSCTVMR